MRFFRKRRKETAADRLETYIAGLIIVQNNLTTQIGVLREEIEKLRKTKNDPPPLSYVLKKRN